MHLTLACLALVAGAALFRPAPALAGESYDNCTGFITSLPATITAPGVWCLNRDLTTAITSGNAITVNANNVTIECNRFRIGGLQAGVNTGATGIGSVSRLNTTVRNCNIRGFLTGVRLHAGDAGGGHLLEGSRFDGNTSVGILVYGPGSTVRNNVVIDTGGSTLSPGAATGIIGITGVDVIDNTVDGVESNGTIASADGISTLNNGAGSVVGNRVRGLVPAGSGAARGNVNILAGRIVVRDNIFQGSGGAGGIGIRCDSALAIARNNTTSGFATGVEICVSSGNTVVTD